MPMPIPGSPLQPTMDPAFMTRGLSPSVYGSSVADGRAPGAVLTNGVASELPAKGCQHR